MKNGLESEKDKQYNLHAPLPRAFSEISQILGETASDAFVFVQSFFR